MKSNSRATSTLVPAIALTIVGTVVLSIVLLTAVDRSVRTEPAAAINTTTSRQDVETVPPSQQPSGPTPGPVEDERQAATPSAPQQPREPTAAQVEAQRQADEAARREAAERAEQEAQERARREAEDRIRREAEERSRREADERARREAEERARQDAQSQLEAAAHEYAKLVTPEAARAAANLDILAEAQTRMYAEESRCWRDDSLEYIQKLEQCGPRGFRVYEDFRDNPGSYRQERYDHWYPQYYESYYWDFIRYNTRR